LCLIADSGEAMREEINHLFQVPFSEEMAAARKRVLSEQFDNRNNAKRITDLIFSQ
jgi:hypothetical protein